MRLDSQSRLCVGRDLGPLREEASDPQEGGVGGAQGTSPRDQAQGGPRRHTKARHGADGPGRGIWGACCRPLLSVSLAPSSWAPVMMVVRTGSALATGTVTPCRVPVCSAGTGGYRNWGSLCGVLAGGTRDQPAAHQLRDLG